MQPLDLSRTLNAAFSRRSRNQTVVGSETISADDLYIQLRRDQPRRLVVFVIDTSDSMGDGPMARMSAALGACVSLAAKSYMQRDQVCLITFRDRTARLVVPPTDSVMRVTQQLKKLPVGGATPLSAGLQKAKQVIRQATIKDPHVSPLLVLISDGEATTPLVPGAEPLAEALDLASLIRRENIPALVIDTLGHCHHQQYMPRIAKALGTSCLHIHNLQANKVVQLIEETKN